MSPVETADAPKPDPYAPWRSRNYRFFSAGWFLLVFAQNIETVAVGIGVYKATGDVLSLMWVALARALPIILLALVGGQVADRFNRRNILAVVIGLNALSSTGLAVATALGLPAGWTYFLLTLGAIAQGFGSPARAAMLPLMVPSTAFPAAVTWNTTIFHVATMTGPGVGGLLMLAQHGIVMALAAAAICRLVSFAAVLMIAPGGAREAPESVSLDSLVAGIRFVWATKPILATITLDLFAVLLGGLTYLLPVFVSDILDVGDWGVGFLRAAEAVGAVVMATIIAHLPPMRKAGITMLAAVAGFGVCTIIFGLSTWYWLSLVMMFLIGALDNISVVVRHTLVQMLTPDEMRGRVSAVNGIFITASNDLGGVESALVANFFGPVVSVVAGGVGTIVVVVAAALKWPQILSIGRLTDLRPAVAAEEELLDESPLP